jgi:hypothetical protein
MADLVFNIQPAGASDIRALNQHIVERVKDGTSAIDTDRSHLNQHLHGHPDGPSASLEAFYKGGVKRPTAQAESPYLRTVISASPEYFRPHDPEVRGTWDEGRMIAWRDRSLAWLHAEFGDDLVYADLHLDEDTPHIHAVIAPTYGKRPRKPGRRKRNETEEQFEQRKLDAENGKTIRTVGRASHPTLSQPGSFKALRERLTAAVQDLGIEYGKDRGPNAPKGISTREWVAQQTVQLRRQREAIVEQERALATRERVLDGAEDEIDAREMQLDQREAQINERESRLRAVYNHVQQLIGSVADHLGVGQTLRAITETIREYVIEPEDYDDDMSPS